MRYGVSVKTKTNIVGEFLNAATALFLVLNCQSVWQNSIDNNYHIYEICFILIILETMYTAFHWNKGNSISMYAVKISVYYYCLIFIVLVLSVSSDNLIRFLSRFLVFPLFMFHFTSQAPMKQKLGIFHWFVNWVAVLSWISVICWLFSNVGIIGETGTINVNWLGWYGTFHGIYYSSPYQCIDWIGHGIRRNIGIFTEGPMFMIVLVLALLFLTMISKYYEPKKWKIIGMVLALLSVASVTGYIVLLIFIGVRMIHTFKNKKTQILIAMIAVIVILIGTLSLLSFKQDTASYTVRFDDYIAGIKCWIKSPIYGNGYENLDLLRTFMSVNRSWNQGFSNTIFSVLAYGGLLFVIPYVVPVIRGIYLGVKKGDYKLLEFSLIYLVLYFTVIFYTFYINFAIWAFLMCKYRISLQENISKGTQ